MTTRRPNFAERALLGRLFALANQAEESSTASTGVALWSVGETPSAELEGDFGVRCEHNRTEYQLTTLGRGQDGPS